MALTRPVKLITEGPKTAANSLSVTFATDASGMPVSMSGSGVKPMAQSVSVTLASDQPALPVSFGGTGQLPMAGSQSVTIASNQTAVPVSLSGSGPQTMAASTSVTLASNQTALPVSVAATGQLAMAASQSVTIASNQSAVPVSLSGSGPQTMAASTSVTLASNQTALPVIVAATGQLAMAGSQSVTIASDQAAVPVSLAAMGARTIANSLAVSLATDQGALSIGEPGGSIVTGSITANAQRVAAAMARFNGASIYISGTYAGVNLSFEASFDNGVTYTAVNAVAINGNTVLTATGALTNTVAAYKVYCPGATHVSVRSTAWTSGTQSVRIAPYAIAMDPNPVVTGALNANQTVNVAQWGGTNSLNGGTAGSLGVGGLAADSAAVSGNPVQTGGRVRVAVDTTLAANDAMALTGTSGMQLLMKPYGLPETDWQFASLITGATVTAARAAGAAGVRNYVTAVQYQNTSATASEIQIQDGATVIWRGQAAASMVAPAVIALPTPLRGTAATALNVQLITTGSNTFVNLQGYQAA
ncbi:MAG: hypothetical protein NTW74_25880 [Acidobacteria bacterium]|nr:hypothetical protein [Acidobacteriota bacterium]